MTSCASCGRENEPHYKFCLGCGANLDEQREAAAAPPEPAPDFCPSCGADVSPGQRFCGSCGFKLEASGGSPTPAEPAAAAAPEPEPAPEPVAAAPSPAPAGDAVGALVMVNPDGSAGDLAPLHAGRNVVGRSSEHAVFNRDPFLSPQHAAFHVEGGAVRVEDLGSLNGVFYRVTEITELQHGDEIRLGQELLRFEVLELCDSMFAAPDDGTRFGGGSTSAWGKLSRVSAPGEASFAYLLEGEETTLGRERGDIVFRDDGYVSGKHARVFVDGGRYFIEDLRSSNGTFLRLRSDKVLGGGALLLLGRQPFRLQLDA